MHPGTISAHMIGILRFFLKIQSDILVWLGTAYEHVPRSGPLQRLGVVSNRSTNQTGHAGMTDSSPAGPSDRNVAGFRQFKQARKFRIPRGGNPATRERDWGARSGQPFWQVRNVINLRHAGSNTLESAEDFCVHIPGGNAPVSQPIAHALQK